MAGTAWSSTTLLEASGCPGQRRERQLARHDRDASDADVSASGLAALRGAPASEAAIGGCGGLRRDAEPELMAPYVSLRRRVRLGGS